MKKELNRLATLVQQIGDEKSQNEAGEIVQRVLALESSQSSEREQLRIRQLLEERTVDSYALAFSLLESLADEPAYFDAVLTETVIGRLVGEGEIDEKTLARWDHGSLGIQGTAGHANTTSSRNRSSSCQASSKGQWPDPDGKCFDHLRRLGTCSGKASGLARVLWPHRTLRRRGGSLGQPFRPARSQPPHRPLRYGSRGTLATRWPAVAQRPPHVIRRSRAIPGKTPCAALPRGY